MKGLYYIIAVLAFSTFCFAKENQIACIVGFTLCGDSCVDLTTDIGNCGQCGTICSGAGQICSQSKCDCSKGLKPCTLNGRTICVDLQKDPSNCGACANILLPTEYCEAGVKKLRTDCKTTAPDNKIICGNPPECVDNKLCKDNQIIGTLGDTFTTISASDVVSSATSSKAVQTLRSVADNNIYFIRGLPGFRPSSSLEEVEYRLQFTGIPVGARIQVWICQDKLTIAECKANTAAIAPANGVFLDAFNNRISVRSKKGSEFHIVLQVFGYDSTRAKRGASISELIVNHAVGIVSNREGIIVVNTNMRDMVTMA
jgi:hypothetical protein